jgi:hypothetical protein
MMPSCRGRRSVDGYYPEDELGYVRRDGGRAFVGVSSPALNPVVHQQRKPMRVSLPPLLLTFLVVGGCKSFQAPPLSVAAEHVRAITAEQGLLCRYIQNVTYTAKLSGWGKTYERIHEAGENGLRNSVATIGGNAVVFTQMDADQFSGRINYAGQAFECSSKHVALNIW